MRLGDCNLHELFCLREGQRTVDYNPSVTSLRTGTPSPCTGEAFFRLRTGRGFIPSPSTVCALLPPPPWGEAFLSVDGTGIAFTRSA